MFQFSTSEKEYVRTALQKGLRTDGRGNHQRRQAHLTSSILDNLAGSSFLSIDHEKC